MSLTTKQKNWILKPGKSKSAKELASNLNVDQGIVEEFLSLQNVTKKPRKVFYLVLLLIPILFFLILEFSLNIFNYGDNFKTWEKLTDTHYGLNPDVAKRYFNSVKSVPKSIQDVFTIKKQPNAFRVFVLGGSSAAGYPFMPLGSFSRYIRQRLEHNYPEKAIEVVNISLTAVNSYTIRDLIPDVLEKEPDLILIYAGHNEYYGALGIGSMESLGKSRSIVNFVLGLNEFKTTQLLRNVLKFMVTLLHSNKDTPSGTLMSRMAQNQKIEYNSELFKAGIDQFEGNMTDVIEMVKGKNVPIIISTVASNLKGQSPFISNDNKINAKSIFDQAKKEYNLTNYSKADSLFRFAKDLDELRFRAPEKINSVINNLGRKFNVPVVKADSELNSQSRNGIIGDSLMTDHLHLTIEGYQNLGEVFYNKMRVLNLLPNGSPKYQYDEQDKITRENFHFSKLDSVIADYKLKMLKNDWPFIKVNQKRNISSLIKPKDFLDSLAYKFVVGKEEWERAHRKLANHYLHNGNFEKALEEYNLLIHQYPIIVNYNKFIANELMKRNRYSESLSYLENGNRLGPNAYYAKWLGIINLSNENIDISIKYLEKSLLFEKNDSQVLFNLSGAYSKKQDFKKALSIVNRCLTINPNYKEAQNLKSQLKAIVK